jgi:hypothetical protein
MQWVAAREAAPAPCCLPACQSDMPGLKSVNLVDVHGMEALTCQQTAGVQRGKIASGLLPDMVLHGYTSLCKRGNGRPV